MKIDEIIPYKKNARHNEKAIPVVAESIKEFGLKGQIILETPENPVIVAGHTRVEACKSLGWDEIPDEHIAFCEDLTEEQIKAYRLADNRTGEIATWNQALLKNEIKDLKGFDMERFKFDFKSKDRVYGAERLRTDQYYNIHLVNIDDCGKCGFPRIKCCNGVPKKMTGFNYAKTATDTSGALHFFVDDCQFERLWNKPEQYIDLIKQWDYVLSPDFSPYMDMPLPMQAWNEYRKRALQNYWERNGVKVIPTIRWTTPDSYDFFFNGIPKGKTVAMSIVGTKSDADSYPRWCNGIQEFLKRNHPKRVLFYGGNPGFDFGDVEVVEYKPETAFKGGATT